MGFYHPPEKVHKLTAVAGNGAIRNIIRHEDIGYTCEIVYGVFQNRFISCMHVDIMQLFFTHHMIFSYKSELSLSRSMIRNNGSSFL